MQNMNSKLGKSNMLHKNNCHSMFFLVLFILVQTSCKKLVETSPSTESVSETNVYSIDATAIAVLNDIYISMNGSPFQGEASISLFASLSSDEMTLYNGITIANYLAYYQNALSEDFRTGSDHWAPLYNYVFKCNASVEGLSKSTTLT